MMCKKTIKKLFFVGIIGATPLLQGALIDKLLDAQQKIGSLKIIATAQQTRIIELIQGAVSPDKVENDLVPILTQVSDSILSVLLTITDVVSGVKERLDSIQSAFAQLYDFGVSADTYIEYVVRAFSGLDDCIQDCEKSLKSAVDRGLQQQQKSLLHQEKFSGEKAATAPLSEAGPASGVMPVAVAPISRQDIEGMVREELDALRRDRFFYQKEIIDSTVLHKNDPEQLFWDYRCPEAPEKMRIEFIADLIEAILKKYSGKIKEKKALIYTSLGSGGFLQDYLAIKTLVYLGFVLEVHLIDPSYQMISLNTGLPAAYRNARMLIDKLSIGRGKIGMHKNIYSYLSGQDRLKSDVIVMVDVHPVSTREGKISGTINKINSENKITIADAKIMVPYQAKPPFINGIVYLKNNNKTVLGRVQQALRAVVPSGDSKNFLQNVSSILNMPNTFSEDMGLVLNQLAQAESNGTTPLVYELNKNTITSWQPVNGSFYKAFEQREKQKDGGAFSVYSIEPDGALRKQD